MFKIGKYNLTAFKISLYFFVVISTLTIMVNLGITSFLNIRSLFHYHHLPIHIVFTLIFSVVMFFFLNNSMFIKNQFAEIIREEEQKYQILFENANDAILLLKNELIIDCNLKTCEIFNCDKTNLIGKSILSISSESENFEVLANLIKQSGKTQQHFAWNYSRNNDKHFEAEVSINQVDLSGQLFIQFIIRDISELKQSRLAISENEEKFKMIFNSVSDGIIIVAEDGEVLEINETALNRLGYTYEYFSKLPDSRKFPTEITNSIQKNLSELNYEDTVTFEIENVTLSNKISHLEMKLRRIVYNGKDAHIAVSRDITQRKKSQQAIYNAVIRAEELERSRVAKELHDGVSPILSTAKLYAQSLRDCSNEELKRNILGKVESTIDESIQSISEISNNLSPHILQNFGLLAAIQSFVNKIKDLKETKIKIVANCKYRFEENIEVTLYRVTIELLNNSLKYADAGNISIRLTNDEFIELIYSDDGKGFNIADTLNRKKGMGLFNIINRVKSLNGQINYNSRPGHGIEVSVKFLPHEA